MDLPIRYPEPTDRPQPGAQWDEIRGVWELWNDDEQVWEAVSEPIAGTADGAAGDREAAVGLLDLLKDVVDEAPNHEQRANSNAVEAGITGVGGDVAHVSRQAEFLDRAEADEEKRHEEIRKAPANPDGIRYPEPDNKPDPHAQWDEHDGIWRVWDEDAVAWVAWRA